jgi:hypothetical protein
VTQLSFASRQASASWRRRLALPVAAAIAAAGLGGCGSISEKFADTASQMPAIGLPAGTPERPATPAAYPAVHDVPPPRNSVMLTNTEAAQMQADLVTARDQQQSEAGLKPQAKKSPAKPPAKVVPASSRGSIY